MRKSDTMQSSFPAGHGQVDDTHAPSHTKVTELAVSSLIALLPPEILCHIFLTALPDLPKFLIRRGIGPISSSEVITGDPWVFARSDVLALASGQKAAALQEVIRHAGSLTLLRLRRLVITHSVLLDSLVTPALQDLHVWGGIAHVLPFLHSSTCALTRLTLSMCDAAADDIILLLRHTPSLTTLCIDFLGPTTTSTALVSALVVRPPAEPLCPHLTSISWGDRKDAMDRAGFVDMVVSRWRVSAPLRRLRFVGLYLGRPRMKGHGRRLRGLADEGMDVIMLNGRKGTQAMDNWMEY
ncbi:hypothetical protein B0H17DRAFT_1197056 [Mycena rosella]|uniref:F-box domain-containing protein n=1 Tax=Mycena rosella TaxID=1033263 RepID=A0AAD7GP01_MYCRO|nr:hypothetical protein B0H17DRAFT_1197056 [Mycena rosella]